MNQCQRQGSLTYLVSMRFCWVSFILDGLPAVAHPPMQIYGGSWDITLKYEYGERFLAPCMAMQVYSCEVSHRDGTWPTVCMYNAGCQTNINELPLPSMCDDVWTHLFAQGAHKSDGPRYHRADDEGVHCGSSLVRLNLQPCIVLKRMPHIVTWLPVRIWAGDTLDLLGYPASVEEQSLCNQTSAELKVV